MRYYRNHSLDGATLFSKLDSYKLRFNVKNEMTLICAKFDADLINILKLQAVKQSVPGFWPTRYILKNGSLSIGWKGIGVISGSCRAGNGVSTSASLPLSTD